MNKVKADSGNWHIECIPGDGARISVLQYDGYDLLTTSPKGFRPPDRFFGEYETRPVYGYDDCFPTVDKCNYPGDIFECRDHGELCWQPWNVIIDGNSLICSKDCLHPSVTFKRILKFEKNILKWKFEVTNLSDWILPFLHVMHALLQLENIRIINLPEFLNIEDEIKPADLGMKEPGELTAELLSSKPGVSKMLLLKKICSGSVRVGFYNGMSLDISFNHILFPTLGIWWNNLGYPDEEGLQRSECAFEPIPGTCSDLSKSFADGVFLSVDPGKTLNWEIRWIITR